MELTFWLRQLIYNAVPLSLFPSIIRVCRSNDLDSLQNALACSPESGVGPHHLGGLLGILPFDAFDYTFLMNYKWELIYAMWTQYTILTVSRCA